MRDFLDVLAANAITTVQTGYYEKPVPSRKVSYSLREAVSKSKATAVIAEIKGASPTKGVIRAKYDPAEVAQAMMRGGAVGISVLTEPTHFNGSLNSITKVRKSVDLPILMKDIIVDEAQLDAASVAAANAVLLIQAVFDRGYCGCGLAEMVAKAHSKGLEVLLETHNTNEFVRAVESDADVVGINNRNLSTLKVDLDVTKSILEMFGSRGKVVVSESGISTPADLRFLRSCGAHAFLIGSAVMLSNDVEAKVRGFVNS